MGNKDKRSPLGTGDPLKEGWGGRYGITAPTESFDTSDKGPREGERDILPAIKSRMTENGMDSVADLVAAVKEINSKPEQFFTGRGTEKPVGRGGGAPGISYQHINFIVRGDRLAFGEDGEALPATQLMTHALYGMKLDRGETSFNYAVWELFGDPPSSEPGCRSSDDGPGSEP